MWFPADGDFERFVVDFGSLVRGLTGGATGGKVLVAFASQTGAAEQIAWRSANALIARGDFVRVAPLGALSVAELAQAGTLLVVTSTYGIGESPDSARSFMRKTMAAPAQLKGVKFAVLALGDRSYEDFCGFGRRLDKWLAASRARRLFDPVLVDGDDDIAAMRQWCENLCKLGANTNVEALLPAPLTDWVLAQRMLLNAASPGGEAWNVALTPQNPALLNWRAGDIAEIWPRNADSAVLQFLAARGLDGAARFMWQDREMALRDILAHSRLPGAHEAAGLAPAQMILQLQAYPHREYSIASLPGSGRLEMLVRKVLQPGGTPDNPRLGIGSGWLTHHAAPGAMVQLRVRPNPNFQHPGQSPAILIGAGTGMAGLRAHLLHRQEQGFKDAWLLFGERSAARDLFYGADIDAARVDGTLARTDLVFSRDASPRRYVQDLVTERGADIRQWVTERGAFILVCGGLGMAAGVEVALVGILGHEKLEEMTRDGSYRRDIY
jgi:sulfite reductase (NADPH) flavoprotein alpha-component